jgi:uncharacterized protein YdeI (YjbR/CyaY-like superfamily)
MRGRFLIGLSHANRQAAGVQIGDDIEITLQLDESPRVVVESADLTAALDANAFARATFNRLSHSRKRELVLSIESAKGPAARLKRIAKALSALGEANSATEGAP